VIRASQIPSVLVDVGVDQAGPRVAFALFGNLLLQLRPERRRDEHVAVARVVEGVEDDLEVVLVEQPIRIAPHFRRDNRRWLTVERVHADVQRLAVVEHPTSVRSLAAAPSRGSCCVNSSTSGAFFQTSSSSTPSIFGG
jgi:hypothetical protein